MKKYLLVIGFLGAMLFTANAQDYKNFRVGLGLGYASPGGEGAKGGVLLYLEPSYRVNDQIAVGLRLETAAMARGVAFSGTGTTATSDAEVSANASYTINGQYYFSNGTFRPFAGLGFGIYSLASVSASVTGGSGGSSSTVEASASTSEFGFYPRLGFDAGHFTMQVEYNLIPATESLVVSGTSTFTSEAKNSYLGVKLGFFIGGGKN